MPLAKRQQKLKCCNFCNFINNKTGVFKSYDINKVTNLHKRFSEDGLLPGFTLRSVYVASWITSYGKKCKRVARVPYDVGHAAFLSKFGKTETVFLIHGFMYFKVLLNNTVKLNEMLQSNKITESLIRNSKVLYMKAYSIIMCATEPKLKTQGQEEAVGLIPMKYSLFDLIEEQNTANNPLFKDFL